MAPSKPKVLLQTLPLLTFLMLLANQVHSQTTSFTFDSFPNNPTDLIYQGDVSVTPGSGSLLLTKIDDSGIPQQNSVGRVVYSSPVIFLKPPRQATFETTIIFLITPVPDSDAADGLTFFIAPVDTTIPEGASGSNLGIFNSSGFGSHIFAVEFDIYPNPDGPFDPSYPHIGIDINSKYSENFTRFEKALGIEVAAHIGYDPNTGTITVVANYGSETAELSYVSDLTTILHEQVQVGVSASTGGYFATHELLSWSFTATVDSKSTGETYLHPYV